MVQLLWKTAWWFLKKLKTELACHPAVPLLGMYLQRTNSKRYTHAVLVAAVFINSNNIII